jgi:hypothetical protein
MREVIISATISVMFDEDSPKRLKMREISDAISEAVSGCSQIENIASVRVDNLEFQHKFLRCKNTDPNEMCGQCELQLNHKGKHLAGMHIW